MGRENTALVTFNKGKISKQGLARVDLDRTRLSAEVQTNFVPSRLGPMSIRPGLGYIGSTYQNKKAFHIPFVAATDDTAILELTDMNMRVRINDTIVSRASVSTAITNSAFNTNLTGWTNADQTGATSSWATGGYLSLVGTGFNYAIRKQTLTIAAPDRNVEHGLRIVVHSGIANIKIGSSDGLTDVLENTQIFPGTHSLAFTPTGATIFLQINSSTKYATLIDSVSIDSAGDMLLPTIWPEAVLFDIRYTQSIDVTFCANFGYRPQRIERHGPTSWAVVDYLYQDGPYRVQNVGGITMTPSAISGDITLTASQNYFKSTNVGSLLSITSAGQTVTSSLTADGQFTNFIKVIGVGSSRTFTVTRSGTWVGTLTLQRSFTDNSSPANTTTTYTTNGTTSVADGLDNEITYYRLGFDTGGYTSGTAVVTLTYSSGGLTGVVRITAYSSGTSVSASVITDMGGTSASSNWSEGLWSDRRGFPSATALYEGRLWWAGKGTIVGSVSDAYDSFEPSTVGDSGPINRTIGEGPVDRINYILPLQRLMMGGQGTEFSIRSSAFDEILTPDNFNIKAVSTQGSGQVAAVKIDNSGIFSQVGDTRVFEYVYNSDIFDYEVQELTTIVPEQCHAGITKIAIQRKPDTRIHCILADGTVALMVYDKPEEVNAWIDVTSPGADGLIEDVVVLPGTTEDTVYYCVKRTINNATVRYLEKWALESECVGGSSNKIADCFIAGNNASASAVLTGLGTLEGEEVVVWADGMDLGTFTVTGAQVTLSSNVGPWVAGLGYDAEYQSVKLAYAAVGGTALTMYKRVCQLGLLLLNTHRMGIQYGGDLDHLNDLPAEYKGRILDDDEIVTEYDDQGFEFDGDWDTDSRLAIKASAPRPCTVQALVMTVETNG